VDELRREDRCEVLLLRRPQRTGGKPGAVNYVLEQTGHLYQYFLLCDNDSTAIDPLAIEKALPYFRDERVAVVQCRSVSVENPHYCWINRLLSRSTDVFHVFLTISSRFGWRPFIGHNAFLRTCAVLEAGAFTPGYFADDLDFTIRLNLRGYAVVYAPEVQLAEKHPPSYVAFRKRSYKWAYGCMQILKAHTRNVLSTDRLSLAEKLSFFHFSGFFVGQAILLVYLVVTFLLGSVWLKGYQLSATASIIAGSVIIFLIYLPILAYFAKMRNIRAGIGPALMCGLIYGTTDFASSRGVLDALFCRKREWIPTNATFSESTSPDLLFEAFFGAALLCVPLVSFPALLYFPCSYLFLGKFLFGPALSILYKDEKKEASRTTRLEPVSVKLTVLSLLFCVMSATFFPVHAENGRVAVQGKELYVEGRPFLVKGMHYGPWRPGTGPNKGYAYPSPEQIESDLRLIRELNANTILVFDPPEYVLDLAQKHDLKVLYTFFIDWWSFASRKEVSSIEESIVKRVKEYREKPALLAWVLGNEVPSSVVDQQGEKPIESRLEALYHSVKAADSQHPITHSNWPPTKDLDLHFLDLISFNVYPLWPPEVVAMGFGNYIREVLRPIAAEKPLLITEFGANTIEAGEEGQARLVKQCWTGIQQPGVCGGVVFEFADEWWKNYDNPKRAGSWWDRKSASDDEKQEDRDPEEHYGLMTADRQPKAASSVVKDMFAEVRQREAGAARIIPASIIGLLITTAFGAWFCARWSTRVRVSTQYTKPVGNRSKAWSWKSLLSERSQPE